MTPGELDGDCADGLSRRSFLRGGALVAAGASGAAGAVAGATELLDTGSQPAALSLHGAHQGGIMHPPDRSHALVSLDVMTDRRDELVDFFKTLSTQIRQLVAGGPATEAFNAGIASDDGMLGPVIPRSQLVPTVSVGASLFDNRYGLAPRKPAYLTTMVSLPNDNLDQTRCHGDVTIALQARISTRSPTPSDGSCGRPTVSFNRAGA